MSVVFKIISINENLFIRIALFSQETYLKALLNLAKEIETQRKNDYYGKRKK